MTTKQIEMEFKNIMSVNLWNWSAKRVADNKFIMRFPSAKMVPDYSNFRLGVRGMDAQMLIEPWNSAGSAKGKLQQAWFRVGVSLQIKEPQEQLPK
jgi:hypothetical protein